MNKIYEEYFYSDDPNEIEKEKKMRNALHSLLPQLMGGTEDKTKYILRSDKKGSIELQKDIIPFEDKKEENKNRSNYINTNYGHYISNNISTSGSVMSDNLRLDTRNTYDKFKTLPIKKKSNPILGNLKNIFNFDKYLSHKESHMVNRPKYNLMVNDSLKFETIPKNNKDDSIWYDNGHLNVTFRNDILDYGNFSPYRNSDKAGCKRRCIEMLKAGGGELSGARIDMTVNDKYGRPITPSTNFRQGIDAINKSLENGRPIILNVDYKDGHASSADKAGDHFIIVVGKTIIDNIVYYHFYDPATSDTNRGTANRNVLYVKDGYLAGNFLNYKGQVNKYKVTSVRLNK